MAALRSAVSPDFTYSQSYLSLLSSAGCMTGVICCVAPSLPAMVRAMRENKRLWWRPSLSSQAQFLEPAVVNSVGTGAARQEEDRNDYDLEKAANSSSDTDGVEKRLTKESLTGNQDTLPPPGDEVNVEALALVDYDRFRETELSIKQGQFLWVHDKRGDGWLVAQDLTTNEIGLVPEKFLQLRDGTTWSSDRKFHMTRALQSQALQSHTLGRAESELR